MELSCEMRRRLPEVFQRQHDGHLLVGYPGGHGIVQHPVACVVHSILIQKVLGTDAQPSHKAVVKNR